MGGFTDKIFGSAPSTELTSRDIRTPQQKGELSSLIDEIGINEGSGLDFQQFNPDDFQVGITNEQNLSLQALEESVLGRVNNENELDLASETALLELITGGIDRNFDQFFENSIQRPTIEGLQEDILPAITRNFGGSNFFSSERADADARALEDTMDSLAQARGQVELGKDQTTLSALDVGQRRRDSGIQELLSLFNAGEVKRSAFAEDANRRFTVGQANFQERDQRIRQLLASINTNVFENIATTSGGSSGILSGAGDLTSFFKGFGGKKEG